MAFGGLFRLITNDGRQDRMLMATSLLNERLKRIVELRKLPKNPKSLLDICLNYVSKNKDLVNKASIICPLDINEKIVEILVGKIKWEPPQTLPFGKQVEFEFPPNGEFVYNTYLNVQLPPIGDPTSTLADVEITHNFMSNEA